MKQLYLVGMAPPQDKKKDVPPFPSGLLSSLVPLDPRHGVFPNLVMTPLMATLYFLKGEPAALADLLNQFDQLLDDKTERRFNVLDKPVGSQLVLSQEALRRVRAMQPEKELWLTFGFWTNCALLSHLTTGETSFSKGTLDRLVREFLQYALKVAPLSFPQSLPSTRTAITGLLCRLCSNDDPAAARRMLQNALTKMPDWQQANPERVITVLRSFVPLPHNEAYQNIPFGKVQNCFMLVADPDDHETCGPPAEVFWRHVGQIVKRRLLLTEQN